MRLDQDLEAQFEFGPFRFIPFERMLLHGDQPLHLGSRAREILWVLIERAGEVVDKQELIARVWPDTIVEDGALRVHIAALRKTLGDGHAGFQYVENVHGQGYRFVAPVKRIERSQLAAPPTSPGRIAADDLPIALTPLIGRDEIVGTVTSRLPQRRFMTLVGPAGIGKTRVAVAAAAALRAAYPDGVRHIDLASLSDPVLIGEWIASRLGIHSVRGDPLRASAAHLHHKSLLLLLDNCEHLAPAVAPLAETLLSGAPNLHILATSREPLRASSEWVLRLGPLEFPTHTAGLNAGAALQFPAIQLFAAHARASVGDFQLEDTGVPIVTEICRRLDGLPLAIELAAAHVNQYGTYGIYGLLSRISTEHDLPCRGPATEASTHHTLNIALAWSYSLLSDSERSILRRLSVFVGTFSLEAAQSVSASGPTHREQTFAAIAGLISKSLLATEAGAEEMSYRLLETTRAYALRQLIESGEERDIAQRHASYYGELLQHTHNGSRIPDTQTALRAEYAQQLSNVRAALQWSFSPEGDHTVGIALAAAGAPGMLELSPLTECRAWMERASAALDTNTRGTHREMQIQAALALSLMHLQGNSDAALTALTRALDLATQLQDQPHRLRLLGALHFFHVRTGQFSNALELAQQAQALARILAVPAAQTLADSMLGISHHLLGNHDRALTHCQAALSQPRITPFEVLGQVGYDHRIRTLVALTRTLWLRGYAEQAVALAWQTLEEADQLGHAVSLGFTLIHIASLLLWVGQTASASVVIERSLAHARGHHLQTYHAVGLGLRAALTLRDGDVTRAIALQQTCLDIMDTERYGILSAVFSGDLADGLAMLGQSSKALALIEATLASHPETFYTPELLRIKARILTRQSDRETPEIAACLMGAIEIARRQGALAWELRAATDLAALWHRSHRREQARQLLAPVYGRFTEGFETPDLLAARQLLLELDRAQS